jgi:hypothetical protein
MVRTQITFNDQEKVDDFVQYAGEAINWNTETGFHTLMHHIEKMKLGIRIEDHRDTAGPKWKVMIQDTEGALAGMGACFDEVPWAALIKAVVQASLNNPTGINFRHNGYSGA